MDAMFWRVKVVLLKTLMLETDVTDKCTRATYTHNHTSSRTQPMPWVFFAAARCARLPSS